MLRLVREINAGLSKLRWFGSYVGDAFVADQFNDQNDLPELHNPSERGLHWIIRLVHLFNYYSIYEGM